MASLTTSSRRRLLPSLFVAIALVAAAPRAHADGEPAARAAALRAEGNRLMDERKYEDAIARFEEALRLTPGEPALYYNLARVHDVRGDAVRALENMEQFLSRATPDLKARVPQLDELAEGMRKRVTRVIVTCAAPTAVTAGDALSRALILVDKQVVANGCKEHDIRVRAGRASFRAEAEGYVGQAVDVDLPGATTKRIALSLAPRDTSGLLRLRSWPEHVNVELEGRDLGQTPLELVLPAGSHTFSLTQSGFEDLSLPVVLAANATRDLDVRLQKTPPIATRWWFWTGIGVVVAAGVGTAIALTTERDPDRGSIPPGVARFPLSR